MSCELLDVFDEDNFNHYGTIVLFNVKNTTASDIESLSISVSNKREIMAEAVLLEPGRTSELFLEMKDTPEIDGAYIIRYKYHGQFYENQFGYFTNGFPLEEVVNIEITGPEFVQK